MAVLVAIVTSPVVSSVLSPFNSHVASADVVTHRSKNFVVHTDLDPDTTKPLIDRLERMLSIVSSYWRRPNRHLIECCVVKDLKAWPPGRLPPLAVTKVKQGSGVTISLRRMRGTVFFTKSVVYAAANTGAAQHEAVHAYCFQMFGSSGPVWYSEGMAEMGRYWKDANDRSVRADPGAIRFLRSSTPPPVKTLTRTGQTSDGWQHYAQRWALCHLLANNPNYGQRFRTLGFSLLGRRPGTSYQSVLGTMNREIEFEYELFLRTLEPGYRVDLCAWDWKSRFRRPRPGKPVTVTVEAARGWQASRVSVQAGRSYQVTTKGTWQTGPKAPAVNADGDRQGLGQLKGTIWSKYQLTREANLGTESTIKPAADGKLFFRCGDRWGRLSDNSGRITVTVTVLAD